MTLERASAFRMPIGKHKDQIIGEIGSTAEGREYLKWARDNFDPERSASILRAIAFYLDNAPPLSRPMPASTSRTTTSLKPPPPKHLPSLPPPNFVERSLGEFSDWVRSHPDQHRSRIIAVAIRDFLGY